MSLKIMVILVIVSCSLFKCGSPFEPKEGFRRVRDFVTSKHLLGLAPVKIPLYVVTSKGKRWKGIFLRLLLIISGDVEPNPGPGTSAYQTYDTNSSSQLVPLLRDSTSVHDLTDGSTTLTQSQQQIDTADQTSSPVPCPRCDSVNSRKRRIECSRCNRTWHLSCVGLKRVQAEALNCWWCTDCLSPGDGLSQFPAVGVATSATPSTTAGKEQPATGPTRPPVASLLEDDGDLALRLAHLKQTRRVIRRIPKGARNQAAAALATLIETALKGTTAARWERLLLFPFLALHVPGRADNPDDSASLTAKIKRQICAYMESDSFLHPATDGIDFVVLNSSPHHKRKRPRSSGKVGEVLQRRVAAKLSDGDVRGAIRLLASSDEIAEDFTEIVEKLKLKHPPAPTDLNMPPPPDDTTQPCLASEAEVMFSVTSFDTGSSAGLDGLRPAHLKDLTSRSAGEAGARLITALTALVNLALRGEVPHPARAAFFGAALTALRKPDGGVRPIAVGCTYRRLATKLALRSIRAELGEQLRPTQLGYGTPGGCEAAVHATRAFSQCLSGDDVIVKIDMKNAFNSARRDQFLSRVRETAPSTYHLLWQAYSKPTPLFCGVSEISSSTGLQQGDPSGPAVFSLAVHQAVSAVTAPFNCWYLDDGTLGGKVTTICSDVRDLISNMAKIGLDINPAKCEIILSPSVSEEQRSSTVREIHQLLPRASVLTHAEMTELGAPITKTAAETIMARKKDELDLLFERLHCLDSHSAFFLLRNCLWLPKLQYLLRAAPIYELPGLLQAMDSKLKSVMTSLTNVRFEDPSWEQAILPGRYGGLGVRRTEDVALPSYVASLHRCQQHISALLPSSCHAPFVQELTKATEDWQTMAGSSKLPDGDRRHQQRAWDSAIIERRRDSLLSQANQFARARLLSAAAPESGAWLRAIPSRNTGTLLDNETLRVSIALRVGAAVCSPHRCKCGCLADSLGYHSLTCQFSAGRHPRHTALNDVIRRSLLSANIPSLLEPSGMDRGDGKRPDGVTIYPFSNGMSLVWDATCINTFADCHVISAAITAGEAARAAELKKRHKYADLAQRYRFEPVAFETGGACGPTTKALVRELGARLTAASGERRETEWLWQRFSIAVIRGNATSILLTSGTLQDESAAAVTSREFSKTSHSHCALVSAGRLSEENSRFRPAGSVPRRPNGDSDRSGDPRSAAEQQARLPPSSMGPGEDVRTLQQHESNTPTVTDAKLIPIAQRADIGKPDGDPLYIGLPNDGNLCYQNAVIQSLLGLRPFLCEMMSLIADRESYYCRTLRSLTKLMVLRQKALSKSIAIHLNEMRDVFADIDPVFRGIEMQDANEFLMRLLNTMMNEIDVRQMASNPIRNNFQFSITESHMCMKCRETVLKRQENICLFVTVPCQQSTETPTLQDAFNLSMRPDLRELLCQYCRHDKCHSAMKISKLPRTLILQMNRYVFLAGESKKIRANVSIPKYLSLSEYITDDATRPPEWKCTVICTSPELEESSRLDAPSASSTSPPTPSPPLPPVSSAPAPARNSSPPRPSPLPTSEEVGTAQIPRLPLPALPRPPVTPSLDPVDDSTYRLVGVVCHHGGSTQSGHYVSDVFCVDKDRWLHYDDQHVSCVTEADVFGSDRQRDGYIFVYMHSDLCSRVVSAATASSVP